MTEEIFDNEIMEFHFGNLGGQDSDLMRGDKGTASEKSLVA